MVDAAETYCRSCIWEMDVDQGPGIGFDYIIEGTYYEEAVAWHTSLLENNKANKD